MTRERLLWVVDRQPKRPGSIKLGLRLLIHMVNCFYRCFIALGTLGARDLVNASPPRDVFPLRLIRALLRDPAPLPGPRTRRYLPGAGPLQRQPWQAAVPQCGVRGSKELGAPGRMTTPAALRATPSRGLRVWPGGAGATAVLSADATAVAWTAATAGSRSVTCRCRPWADRPALR